MCAIFIIGLIYVHALCSGKRALKHRKACTRWPCSVHWFIGIYTPGETTEPEKPGETTEPEKPGETTEPEKPGETTEPEKPGETTEPEKPSSGGTDTNTGKDKENKTKTTVKIKVKSKKNASVKTGDSSKPILWAVLMLIAIAGITRSLMLRKKN